MSSMKAVTFSGRAVSSDAALIKLRLRSKYPSVRPARPPLPLILHLSQRLWVVVVVVVVVAAAERWMRFIVFVKHESFLSLSSLAVVADLSE